MPRTVAGADGGQRAGARRPAPLSSVRAAEAPGPHEMTPPTSFDAEALLAAGGLGAAHHRMELAEAGALVEARFGVRGDLVRFETEKDDSFLVSPPAGPRFVLKVANPAEDAGELDLQTALLLHLERTAPSLPVPRVVRACDGQAIFAIEDEAGQRRQVRALGYLEGTPLDRMETTPRERMRLGAVLGALRLAMADFAHPRASREIAWDVKHLARLRGLVGHIADPGRRRALEQGLDRFDGLAPRLRALPAHVVHNDCSRSNLVADRASPGFITGVIDFGDVVRTAVAIDVSTTLLNQLSVEPADDIFAGGRDVLAGYLSVAPLRDDELAMVPHLVMARVIARALITTWRAARMPDNARYILRNTHAGWHQLDWFLARPVDTVDQILLDRPPARRAIPPRTPPRITPGRAR
jgi:hydroxylysine kinase